MGVVPYAPLDDEDEAEEEDDEEEEVEGKDVEGAATRFTVRVRCSQARLLTRCCFVAAWVLT